MMSSCPAPSPVSPEQVKNDTVVWLERAVIGLNLCPFAKAVHVKSQVRYVVFPDSDPKGLLEVLKYELKHLECVDAAVTDTTLLIAPYCLQDFLEFNEFLGLADRSLRKLRLEGVLQIASLHPAYQFAGTEVDDITNCTNRSPYPTLHLLREASIDRAVAAFPDPEAIFENNMRTMEKLGPSGWAALGLKSAP
jgi:hypothetical protein